MLAVLLALASAVSYGSSDFAAGLASRKASVLMVTFLSTVCALVPSLIALPLLAHRSPSAAALTWGAVAGLGGMSGALALYAGFRRAAFSVAAPLSAVGAAGLSVLAGILLGERPAPLSLAGIGVALPAIVLVSLTASSPGPEAQAGDDLAAADTHTHHRALAGVGYGLVAGAGFALLFVGLNRAGSRAGLWPVVSGQVAEVVVLTCIVAISGAFWSGLRGAFGINGSSTAGLAVITGITGGGGTIIYFFATHHGFLAITAVLTSLYPAVTIGLARLLASERLSPARLAGLVLAGISVTLIALGGTG